MFKVVIFAAVVIVAVSADPKPGILAAAPLAAGPAVVTATSSQSFIRNVAAPFVAGPAVVSPYAAAPAVVSPYAAAPAVVSPYLASPYLASPYVASPYASPLIAV